PRWSPPMCRMPGSCGPTLTGWIRSAWSRRCRGEGTGSWLRSWRAARDLGRCGAAVARALQGPVADGSSVLPRPLTGQFQPSVAHIPAAVRVPVGGRCDTPWIAVQRKAGMTEIVDHGQVAAVEMRSRALEPLQPYPGTNKPRRCRCTVCGGEVAPRLSNIHSSGHGPCRHCENRL